MIFTRSNNDQLYDMMQSLLPLPARKCDWFNHWTDAVSYLSFIIQQGEGWIVNCDNDCFIHNWSEVQALIIYMQENGYTHCGMRDAGVSPHRNNDHEVMNPFFNVFNAPALKPLLDSIVPCENNIEPYNALFKHFHHAGKPLYLDAATLSDGISTHLMSHRKTYFALHSWYSREYNSQKERIDNVYETAKYYRSI